MLIVNKLMSLISFILLVLCMLAPMKKNRILRGNKTVQVILKPHAVYGILILMTSLIHGFFAGKKAGMMTGKLAWCCLLLLLVLAGYQKRRNTRGWLLAHRWLSAVLCVLVIVHMIHGIVMA